IVRPGWRVSRWIAALCCWPNVAGLHVQSPNRVKKCRLVSNKPGGGRSSDASISVPGRGDDERVAPILRIFCVYAPALAQSPRTMAADSTPPGHDSLSTLPCHPVSDCPRPAVRWASDGRRTVRSLRRGWHRTKARRAGAVEAALYHCERRPRPPRRAIRGAPGDTRAGLLSLPERLRRAAFAPVQPVVGVVLRAWQRLR